MDGPPRLSIHVLVDFGVHIELLQDFESSDLGYKAVVDRIRTSFYNSGIAFGTKQYESEGLAADWRVHSDQRHAFGDLYEGFHPIRPPFPNSFGRRQWADVRCSDECGMVVLSGQGGVDSRPY